MKKSLLLVIGLCMAAIGFSQIQPNNNSVIKGESIIQPGNPNQLQATPLGGMVGQSINPSNIVPQNTVPNTQVAKDGGQENHGICPNHDKTKEYYESIGMWEEYQQSYLDGIALSQNYSQNKTPGTNTIAIIFHVVHEGEPIGTGTNVSNAAIMAMYNDLVEDFSLTNTDQSLARTGLGFNPVNTGINFCLATQTPAGAPLSETGVTRFQTTETWFDPDNPAEVNAMKSAPFGQPIWDRTKYLNVWICDISNGAGSGVAGYAYKPTISFLPPASIDGIVVDYNLGVNNDNVLTHEVGHYLGLDHTWGGSGGCGNDDGFADTPNTSGPSFDYANSCNFVLGQQNCPGIETQFENYMDYANCTVMFTSDQSNLMNTILSGIRSSLLISPGCDPAGPPICAFTSSPAGPGPVIIPESGTVVFQDASTGVPTGWTWTVSPGVQGTDWAYTGGTNANSQNPQVTFYNSAPGPYTISLVASNGFGSCAGVTEVDYVDVVLPAAGTGCDTLRNWDPAQPFFVWNAPGAGWGSYPGHANNNGTTITSDSYAERFNYVGTAEVRRLRIPIFLIDTNVVSASTITFTIWDDAVGPEPGAILATETVNVRDLNDYAYNIIDFTTPTSVTGQFWAGYQLQYDADQDTVEFVCTNTIGGGNDSWMMELGGIAGWTDMDALTGGGPSGSIAMDVLLSNGPSPVADFQFDDDSLCVGGSIVVNGSGSTNATDYEWYLTDNPVTTTLAFNGTAGTTFSPSPAGDYAIFLFVDGSCETDGLVLPITVLPAVSATINVTNTTCGLINGSVSIVSPTGGDGITYEYSLDGVAWSTTTTYNNLPSGNYTAWIRTDGDACETQIPFTINSSVPLSGTVSPSAVGICPGGNANLTASGGTGYTWYDGATIIGTTATINVTPSVSTSYSCEITNGVCTDIQYANVNVNPLPTVGAGIDQDVCAGGSVTLSGTGAASYSWNNGVTNGVAFVPASTLTYTVTGTDVNGCQNTDQVVVTVDALPTVSAGSDQAVCTGGSVTLNGSGAVSYTWNNGVTDGAAFTPVSTLTYTVTGTDGNGCQNTDQAIVTVNSLPSVSAGPNQAVCIGGNVTLSGSGASTYTWDNGVTNGSPFSPASTLTYTVTGTDGNGCQNTDQAIVTVNPLPTVGAGVDQAVCAGTSATLSGTGAASYSWNNGISNGVAFTPAATLTYTVTGTDGNGCQNTDQAVVTVNSAPSVSGLTEVCNVTNTDYTLSFNISGGLAPYVVTGAAGSLVGSTWTSNLIPTGTPYNVTITDDNGCTFLVSGVQNCACTTDAGTMVTAPTIVICGTGPATATHNGDQVFDGDDAMEFYLHNAAGSSLGTVTSTNGSPTFSFIGGMTFGTTYYISSVAGNDIGGGIVDLADPCFSVANGTPVIWYALPTVVANSDQSVCAGTSVTLSGSGAASYTWDNGISDGVAFTASSTLTYTVTGTDGNGCQNTDQATITVNALPTVSAGSDQAVCAGGSVTLSGSGASTYIWNNGVTNGVAFVPALTNTYTVTGTDGNGCQNTDQAIVTVNSLPTVGAGTDQSTCAGNSVTLNGSGASTYTWDNGVTNATAFTPASTLTYTVTGTDGNGCQGTDQVIVTVNTLPTVSAGPDFSSCDGAAVTLFGSGAASFTWDNGVADGVSFTPTVTLTYTVTGTDVNGCQNTDQVMISINTSPTVDAGIDQTICAGDPVTLSGAGALTYVWNNGVTDGVVFNPSTSTTYTVTGTDGNGCTDVDQVDVFVNPLPTVSAGLDTTLCGGESIILSGSGATSYTWDNGVTDAVSFIPTATTTYTVTGTDGNGCINTDQVTVTVNSAVSVTGVVGHDTGSSDGSIDVTISGGTAPYTITWDNGPTTEDQTGLAAGDYTITVTDALGCQTIVLFTVLDVVSVFENALDKELTIYPNPSQGMFMIQLEGNFDIEITDARGRLIIKQNYTDNTAVDLTSYEDGIYFVRIMRDGQMAIRKLMKQ